MHFRILYQDPFLIAIDKPAGFHVHPPEDATIRISRSLNCLALLRQQCGQHLYPVHRLDAATAGVLLFALDPETARATGEIFRKGSIRKTYYCVTRGWVEEEGAITRPLAAKSDPDLKLEAETRFRRLARIELPVAVGRYGSARYSLVRAEPLTGRYHQIRRHFAGASHPLLGDSVHGDGHHNRFLREHLGFRALLLKAQMLRLRHPRTQEPLLIESRWNGRWHRVFELFGICPYPETESVEC